MKKTLYSSNTFRVNLIEMFIRAYLVASSIRLRRIRYTGVSGTKTNDAI